MCDSAFSVISAEACYAECCYALNVEIAMRPLLECSQVHSGTNHDVEMCCCTSPGKKQIEKLLIWVKPTLSIKQLLAVKRFSNFYKLRSNGPSLQLQIRPFCSTTQYLLIFKTAHLMVENSTHQSHRQGIN